MLAQLAGHMGPCKSTILHRAESLEARGYFGPLVAGTFTLGPTPMRLAVLYVVAGNLRLCAHRVQFPLATSDNLKEGELLVLDRCASGHVLQTFTCKPDRSMTR